MKNWGWLQAVAAAIAGAVAAFYSKEPPTLRSGKLPVEDQDMDDARKKAMDALKKG